MKISSYAFIFLMVLTVSISGCAHHGDEVNGEEYRTGEIFFQYPAGWNTFYEFWSSDFDFNYIPQYYPDLDTEEVAGVLDPASSTPHEKYTTWVKVYKKSLPAGSSVESVFSASYPQNSSSFKIITNTSVEIRGNNSYELVYQKYRGENLYQVKDVWFAGRENVYIISCWTLPLNYQKNENKFQVIIDSFTVL